MPHPISNTTYTSLTKTFHWLTALLIFAIIPLGVIAHDLAGTIRSGTAPEGAIAQVTLLFSLHKTLGVVLFLTALLRIIWAFTHPKPAPLHPDRKLETLAAETVHWLLYGSLVIVPLSGWIHHAATTGFAPIWGPFGQSLPFVAKDETVSAFFSALHNVFSKVMIASILLHIAGALKHHFIDRDWTLRRMWFGKSQAAESAQTTKHAGHFTPLLAAFGVWGIALAVGGFVGVFSSHGIAAPKTQLAEVESDWIMQDHSLDLSISQFGNTVAGAFANLSAKIDFDPQSRPAGTKAGHVEIVIAIDSLTLGTVTDQAKGFDFFDLKNHPTATFRGDIISATDNAYAAVGTLEIKGIEMPLTLPFDLVIDQDSDANSRATMTAQVTLDRRDFAIGGSVPDEATLGFSVNLRIALSALKAMP